MKLPKQKKDNNPFYSKVRARLQYAYYSEVIRKILGPQQHKATLLYFGTLVFYLSAHTELSETFRSVSKDPREVSCSSPDHG